MRSVVVFYFFSNASTLDRHLSWRHQAPYAQVSGYQKFLLLIYPCDLDVVGFDVHNEADFCVEIRVWPPTRTWSVEPSAHPLSFF